mmetsp:Transcript_53966/g.101317  ORF Transcript_53966/g.101317 Transcript_53966/m.101317 type:complete len:350 (-) Transcript_53966:264-1313(-)
MSCNTLLLLSTIVGTTCTEILDLNSETPLTDKDSQTASPVRCDSLLQVQFRTRQGAPEAQKKHRTIHLLGDGRSGSCFLGDLLHQQPLPYVFEPDLNDGYGLWVSENVKTQSRIDCLYTCERCAAIVKNQAAIDRVCAAAPQVVAIKTVGGLSDLGDLLNIPNVQLLNTRFVLMLRDPRAQRYSVIKANWRLGLPDCRVQLLQYLSAKELLKKVPRDQLRVIFFEHWSQDVETFAPELFEWAGLNMSSDARAHAISSASSSALEWTTKMSQDEVDRVDQAPYCDQYMKLLGYPRRPSTLQDFSSLNDPFAAPPTANEMEILAKLRQEAKVYPNLWRVMDVPNANSGCLL